MFSKIDNLVRQWFVSRLARREYARKRVWLFVDAYGPRQARIERAMTFDEATKFAREVLSGTFVKVDLDNSIFFFDSRKNAG